MEKRNGCNRRCRTKTWLDILKFGVRNMIIIAFSDKTSKILPRLICRKFKHVAPIAVHNDKLVMYQFVRRNICVKVHLRMKDIKILNKNGWRFIYLTGDVPPNFNTKNVRTCVELTKRAIGLESRLIQTPNALYKYLI